jgi:hypothetical protein
MLGEDWLRTEGIVGADPDPCGREDERLSHASREMAN